MKRRQFLGSFVIALLILVAGIPLFGPRIGILLACTGVATSLTVRLFRDSRAS